MVFIEQNPLLNYELARHAIVALGKNTLFLSPLLAAIMRGPLVPRPRATPAGALGQGGSWSRTRQAAQIATQLRGRTG